MFLRHCLNYCELCAPLVFSLKVCVVNTVIDSIKNDLKTKKLLWKKTVTFVQFPWGFRAETRTAVKVHRSL